jgi:hypothetical protein
MEYNQRKKWRDPSSRSLLFSDTPVPYTTSPLWFLGQKVSSPIELETLLSKLIWITYRYDFQPIGSVLGMCGFG